MVPINFDYTMNADRKKKQTGLVYRVTIQIFPLATAAA